MRKHIIILNGPPGVGKDTIANLIAEKTPFFEHMRFKIPLYADTARYFSINIPTFIDWAEDRNAKEAPVIQTATGLISPREALIHVSEDLVKPAFGNDHYGLLAAKKILLSKSKSNVIFSDGGFVEELLPIANLCHKLWIVRLHRKDFNFNTDSRDYISDKIIEENDNFFVQDLLLQEDNPNSAIETIFTSLGFCQNV